MKKKIIIGITGADGVCLGVRLLEHLRELPQVETHLVMTESAERNLRLEGAVTPEEVRAMADCCYAIDDMAALIASGSFVTEGMLIVPCSMKTLAAISSGYTENLLQRAADVCLKERRRVVIVPREMPLGRVHLRNMLQADELGCTIVPPVLTFYNQPRDVADHMDHILGKALLQFGLELPGFRAWQGGGPTTPKKEARNDTEEAFASLAAGLADGPGENGGSKDNQYEYTLQAGQGPAAVTLMAKKVGKDLQVLLTAGRAHVGAVALAVPCGTNAEGVTASASTLTAPGHRDNIPAEQAALTLCKALGCNVTVTAGLHLDQASQEQIAEMVENARAAVMILLRACKK